mgnify:CR=1 FL=1
MIDEPDAPSNVVIPRYRLRQNMFPICPVKLHTCRDDTKATDKHQSHRCNTTLPSEPRQSSVEWLPGFEPKPLPSLKYSVFCGLPPSKRRFCFFIPYECEDFIHLSFFHFAGHRRCRQGFCLILHPKRNSSMMNFQTPSNPPQIASIYIHF